MDPRERFAALMADGSSDLALGALCIAQCARPDVDVAACERELDRLGAAVNDPSLEGIIDHVCRVNGFSGDQVRYDDPRNSFLDLVLTRRRGIPITLAVVAIDVARRGGAELFPIGMPGHFLVGDGDRFGDVFHGRVIDRAGCAAMFHQQFGERRKLPPLALRPAKPAAVFARMLNNLELGPLGCDLAALGWMLDLHVTIPDLDPMERAALAGRLERIGRFRQAAHELEAAATALTAMAGGVPDNSDDDDATRTRSMIAGLVLRAAGLRARSN